MAESDEPTLGFSFYIELNDVIEAGFVACTGLSVRRDVLPVQEGGINDFVHVLPGRVTYANLTLKRGIAFSDRLWRWFETGILADAGSNGTEMGFTFGLAQRSKVSIHQCVPYTTTVIRQYELTDALPVAWTGPDLNTSANEVAVESIEIAFSRFTVQNFSRQAQ